MSWRIAFMKSTIQRALFAIVVATLGAAAVGTACAQAAPAAQTNSAAENASSQSRGDGGNFRHERGHFRHGRGHFHHRHGRFHHGRGHFRGGRFAGSFGGAPFVGSLLRATRQLDLTTAQRDSLRSILQSARPTRQPGAQSQAGAQPQHPALTVLGNPSDPGYAAAVQRAEADATSRIQKQSALAGKIYAVLTPAQQKQLPQVLASMQSREQPRGGRWGGRRGGGDG
jgi:Spy/CpxP family protein refolding chaperone